MASRTSPRRSKTASGSGTPSQRSSRAGTPKASPSSTPGPKKKGNAQSRIVADFNAGKAALRAEEHVQALEHFDACLNAIAATPAPSDALLRAQKEALLQALRCHAELGQAVDGLDRGALAIALYLPANTYPDRVRAPHTLAMLGDLVDDVTTHVADLADSEGTNALTNVLNFAAAQAVRLLPHCSTSTSCWQALALMLVAGEELTTCAQRVAPALLTSVQDAPEPWSCALLMDLVATVPLVLPTEPPHALVAASWSAMLVLQLILSHDETRVRRWQQGCSNHTCQQGSVHELVRAWLAMDHDGVELGLYALRGHVSPKLLSRLVASASRRRLGV
ncbi:uncharacterized protein MONBRDRAFT_5612 [Monosiga brevicollis MX1]|uniref:Uncharacterized protein n=1 Tax=Monosiga brevicollis TaxID=81824 RepID=A9URY4_MONBE|nr:uncharacterized protein MONBRDRAFT_5612 [Monosiga brevicollis MX1]EDQ92007.1 predicted protein [Monosiga brevicollis MX1]|eukprot:XP_001743293.1 hypothetical protein [Monosiga brevicollis MX1]